jgi:mannosyl-3-phosphoglycerate phosphatase
MLAPRFALFTSADNGLLQSEPAISDALAEIARRRVPLVLATAGTRAQLEPLRQKLEHAHPFITESGGAIFFPDGYFSLRLEGAVRVARYFCAPFGKPYAAVTAALEEIALRAGTEVVGYSQMSARDIARNTGEPLRAAELARQREFSERFFFAGDVAEAPARFAAVARESGWELAGAPPFWELRSGNSPAAALRYLMRLYRASQHSRLRSVAIGSVDSDLPLLAAADHAILLPPRRGEFDATLAAKLPRADHADEPGASGWNLAVLKILEPA